jgi:hypothetical protein
VTINAGQCFSFLQQFLLLTAKKNAPAPLDWRFRTSQRLSGTLTGFRVPLRDNTSKSCESYNPWRNDESRICERISSSGPLSLLARSSPLLPVLPVNAVVQHLLARTSQPRQSSSWELRSSRMTTDQEHLSSRRCISSRGTLGTSPVARGLL